MIAHVCHFFVYGVAVLLLLLPVSSAFAKDCRSCHDDLFRQGKGGSHHVQGVALSGKHCYACHWEADRNGEPDKAFHNNIPGQVDLVIWSDEGRPGIHTPGITAISFRPTAMGTRDERSAVANITQHCLSCHNDRNNDILPFEGDSHSPRHYAWDGQSIASRYANTETTVWGKYSTAGTNRKQQVVKSLSAHGNASANNGGWSSSAGYDGQMPVTRGGKGASRVECFDCHNSHGSTIPGITSSYRTVDGSQSGGLLKETHSGKSGYRMDYIPSVNSYPRSQNPFNAGAGLCFDCHETAKSGNTPWGYSSTFGASQPIMGYKDTPGFGPGTKGSSARHADRMGRTTIASSHLKGGNPLGTPAQTQIQGLCTPCHDPHGVSRTLNDKMSYAVPLLKGTWLTSPYREDGPPEALPGQSSSVVTERKDFNAVNRESGANFGKGGSTLPRGNDFNTVNRQSGANFGKGSSTAPTRSDFNEVNRLAGSNFGKTGSEAPRTTDFNAVNREAGANFGNGESTAPNRSDFNEVNRLAGSNFGKKGSEAPRTTDFNAVNREAGANFGKGESTAPSRSDFNEVNRLAGSNFGKKGSEAPRTADFNAVNREAGANFGKGESAAPNRSDFNEVNRLAGSNFGKKGSEAPHTADFNAVNREAGANFGKEGSDAPLTADFNAVNRETGVNFSKGASAAPRGNDFNAVNRQAGANFGRDDSSVQPANANVVNRNGGANFGKGSSGTPRQPMQGMKYNVDRNTFGKDNRIAENDDTFGGLCLKCHAKEHFAGDSANARIHRTVKGWGANAEHAFPCSKCHQAHNSGLPRLMQTNCFELGPSGLREESGIPWLPFGAETRETRPQPEKKSSVQNNPAKTRVVGCHVRQFSKATAPSSRETSGTQWHELSTW